jgi:hypothetical protein
VAGDEPEPEDPPSSDPDQLVVPAPAGSPLPAGGLGMGLPIIRLSLPTPLAQGEVEESIPPAVLWSMKYRRHLRLGSREDEELREHLGEGDEAVYFIDDGPNRCMVGRIVGTSSDGCIYCLVASTDLGSYWSAANGTLPLTEIFSGTRHLSLCSVYQADRGASNVMEVERFSRARDVPAEYLPPHPLIEFTDEQ